MRGEVAFNDGWWVLDHPGASLKGSQGDMRGSIQGRCWQTLILEASLENDQT